MQDALSLIITAQRLDGTVPFRYPVPYTAASADAAAAAFTRFFIFPTAFLQCYLLSFFRLNTLPFSVVLRFSSNTLRFCSNIIRSLPSLHGYLSRPHGFLSSPHGSLPGIKHFPGYSCSAFRLPNSFPCRFIPALYCNLFLILWKSALTRAKKN